MSRYKIAYFLPLLLLLVLQTSCKKEGGAETPGQPDFIKTSLSSTLSLEGGNTFDLYVAKEENVESYEWTVPDLLEIIEGQGTFKITVRASGQGGTIQEKAIKVVARNPEGSSYPRIFYKEISILKPPPTLEGYRTKRYGSKTWMVENLNYAGPNGDLGRLFNADPSKGGLYGRLYTWHEAMTGLPGATAAQNPYKWGAEGIDDAGNPYTLDGTSVRSFNIQIQGACPKGWHVPNAYDWYDLIVAVKAEHNVPGASLSDVANSMEGYIIGWERDNGFTTGLNLTNWGVIAPYFKGSRPQAEGGLWEGGTTFRYAGNAIFRDAMYPLFTNESANVGFNILPGGRWNEGSRAFQDEGRYSYHWSAYLKDSQNHNPLRFTIGSLNANLSNAEESPLNALCLRCVANY